MWFWCPPLPQFYPLILSKGDGQARGLAAFFVFHLMIGYSAEHSLKDEPTALKIMESLINIPTVFERNRDDSAEDLLVAQAVRQNVKATMQLPLNTVEWARLTLRSSGITFASRNRDMIISCMQRLTHKYDSSPEVAAYDNVSQAPKMQRMGALVEGYGHACSWWHGRRG